MKGKLATISRLVNSITIEQRVVDGFFDGTAISVAHRKDINDWFTTKDTFELFIALAIDLGLEWGVSLGDEVKTGDLRNLDFSRLSASKYTKIFPGLIFSKRGSPANGGGTWIHPDLAVQLAQWCNKPFAIQVSRWVREWIASGQDPVTREEGERLVYRDNLKDEARLRLTNQVMRYLRMIRRYVSSYRGGYFSRVHDAINLALTGEKAKQMRERLSQTLGRKIKDSELIRDFFPAIYLQRYIAICETVANLSRKGVKPLDAVKQAAELVLPEGYQPTPIDFTDDIKFIRQKNSVVRRSSAS